VSRKVNSQSGFQLFPGRKLSVNSSKERLFLKIRLPGYPDVTTKFDCEAFTASLTIPDACHKWQGRPPIDP
jgi:hypothetical protein